MLPVVHVIHRLVIRKIRGEPEEASQSRTGRGTFKVGVREEAEDRCGNIIEATVLPDAVVDVNGTDALGNSVADPFPASQGILFHGSIEIPEG